jgi:hypothetical protein
MTPGRPPPSRSASPVMGFLSEPLPPPGQYAHRPRPGGRSQQAGRLPSQATTATPASPAISPISRADPLSPRGPRCGASSTRLRRLSAGLRAQVASGPITHRELARPGKPQSPCRIGMSTGSIGIAGSCRTYRPFVRARVARQGTSLTGRAMRRANASKLGLPIIPWGPRRIGLVAE